MSDEPGPRCSIVIPVHNNALLTRQCLDTLLEQLGGRADVEIIVVDDGSTDATQAVLAGYGGRIQGLTQTVNSGFAHACTAGAALAGGEHLVFLNNDTIPLPGWLDALVGYAEQHPAAAIIGSKLLYPDDTVEHAGVVILQNRVPEHIYSGFPADHPAVNVSRRFQVVTGACMLVRRLVFEQVGGFDTVFVNGFEDVDLCLRVGALGHEVHYCHTSVLYHLAAVSREHRPLDDADNGRIFSERWRERLVPDDLQYYLADGLLTLTYRQRLVQFTISPLLGYVAGDEQQRLLGQQLSRRGRQVSDLVRENTRLNLRLREAEAALRGEAGREGWQ